jgi:[ribosomal protein S18]-alanine N-acetyltransferase
MHVRLMQRQDITQVVKIDREVFPTDWPPTNFSKEIDNRLALYLVATENPPPACVSSQIKPRQSFYNHLKSLFVKPVATPSNPENPVLGYAGIWILADEAHVMSIASGLEHRRRGIGEALLLAIFELAKQHRARVITLEVRVSNIIAQKLYIKFGFKNVGIRKGYYLDNREDAIIMTTDYLESEDLQKRLGALWDEFTTSHGQTTFDLDRHEKD